MVNFMITAGLDTNNVTAGLNAIEKRFKTLSGTVSGLAGSFGVAFGVRAIIDQLDAYKNLQNRIKAVTDASTDLAEINNTLLGIANRSGASIAATTQIYSRLATSQKALGISTNQLTDFTETLSKTIAISGATSYEAQGSLIQFSQAMASGALRGDELRAVMEQLPEVANVIAKQFGVTTGQLAILGKQGKLTSEQILIAFSKAAPDIEARFQKTSFTIANSFVILKNNILFALGALDNSSGFSEKFSKALIFLAKNIDVVVEAVKNLVIFLGPGYLIRVIKTLTVVAATNPFILIATVVATLIASIPELTKRFEGLIAVVSELFERVTGIELSFDGVFNALISGVQDAVIFVAEAFDSVIGTLSGLGNAIGVLFDEISSRPKVVAELLGYYLQRGFQKSINFIVALMAAIGDTIIGIASDVVDFLKNSAKAAYQFLSGNLEAVGLFADNATSAIDRAANRVTSFGNVLSGKQAALDVLFRPINKPGEEARKLGELVASEYERGLQESGSSISQSLKDVLFGEGFGVLTVAAQQGKAAADAFASGFQAQIGIGQTGVGVLAPEVLDARAAERQKQAAFAPRGALGLIPDNFKSPGSAGGAGSADAYAKQIEQLQVALALDYARIRLGEQSAEFLAKQLELEAAKIELSGDEYKLLKSLTQQQQDYAAATQYAQQLDVGKQLLDQERALNLLLAERPDLADSINNAMLSAKITALEASTALEDGFTRAFLKLQQEAQNLAAVGEQVVNVFADKMTDALTTFLTTGEFNFKQFATSILDEITKILVRLLIVQAITAAVGGGPAGPAAASLIGGLGGGGGRARGGTVQPDRSYIVGEQGPEIFQPRTTGTIIPNSVPATPPQVNVQVVNVDDPNSVPAAINKGGSDEAIINVLARNRDRVRQTIG